MSTDRVPKLEMAVLRLTNSVFDLERCRDCQNNKDDQKRRKKELAAAEKAVEENLKETARQLRMLEVEQFPNKGT